MASTASDQPEVCANTGSQSSDLDDISYLRRRGWLRSRFWRSRPGPPGSGRDLQNRLRGQRRGEWKIAQLRALSARVRPNFRLNMDGPASETYRSFQVAPTGAIGGRTGSKGAPLGNGPMPGARVARNSRKGCSALGSGRTRVRQAAYLVRAPSSPTGSGSRPTSERGGRHVLWMLFRNSSRACVHVRKLAIDAMAPDDDDRRRR